MGNIFEIHELIYDNSLWLAIIAINMTIIGLTSLAETKKIIGVDYGKFLIKHYKVIGLIRIYYLLIIFASINIVSLITMFIVIEQVRTINLIVLLLSLIFAIYYFFSFILIENSSVKHQIYKDEILGMYYKSNDKTTFLPDIIVKMNNGWRTEKRLSTNVISYFNNFNNETQKSFEEIFGLNSLLYSKSWSVRRYWKRKYDLCAYDYKSKFNFVHISHEFFQLFRYTDLQDKWILEILRLFNGMNTDGCKEYKMDNMIRIIGHLINFGKCDNLYKYKFIEYFEVYVFNSFRKDEHIDANIINKEKFLIKEFTKFIFIALRKNEDTDLYKVALMIFNKFTNSNEFTGNTDVNSILKLIFNISKEFNNDTTKRLMTELYNNYLQKQFDDPVKIEEIKKILTSVEKREKGWISTTQLYD